MLHNDELKVKNPSQTYIPELRFECLELHGRTKHYLTLTSLLISVATEMQARNSRHADKRQLTSHIYLQKSKRAQATDGHNDCRRGKRACTGPPLPRLRPARPPARL